MLTAVVKFPLTSAVCFIWAQAVALSILVNGV